MNELKMVIMAMTSMIFKKNCDIIQRVIIYKKI